MIDSECSLSSCPFAYTEESELAQSYGCLPTPYQIVVMRVAHNKTWACHSEPTTPCVGAIKDLAARGLPYKVVDPVLLTEQSAWHLYAYTNEKFDIPPTHDELEGLYHD